MNAEDIIEEEGDAEDEEVSEWNKVKPLSSFMQLEESVSSMRPPNSARGHSSAEKD